MKQNCFDAKRLMQWSNQTATEISHSLNTDQAVHKNVICKDCNPEMAKSHKNRPTKS